MNNEQITFFQTVANNVITKEAQDLKPIERVVEAMMSMMRTSKQSEITVTRAGVFNRIRSLSPSTSRFNFEVGMLAEAVNFKLVVEIGADVLDFSTEFSDYMLEAIRPLTEGTTTGTPESTSVQSKQPMLMFTITVRGKPYTGDQLESLCNLLTAYALHQNQYDNDSATKVTFGEEVFTQKDVHDLLEEMSRNPLTRALMTSFGYPHPRGGSRWDSDRNGNLIMRNRGRGDPRDGDYRGNLSRDRGNFNR